MAEVMTLKTLLHTSILPLRPSRLTLQRLQISCLDILSNTASYITEGKTTHMD